MTARLVASDVVVGLVRALADRGITGFDGRPGRVDSAFLAVYEALEAGLAGRHGLDVRFVVRPDRLHGISRTAQEALGLAVSLRLLHPTGGSYSLDPARVRRTVGYEHLPGAPALYLEMAEVFVEALRSAPAT